MFNKPKTKVSKTKAEYKAKIKKNKYAKKYDQKSKYGTSFKKPKLTVTFDLDARRYVIFCYTQYFENTMILVTLPYALRTGHWTWTCCRKV